MIRIDRSRIPFGFLAYLGAGASIFACFATTVWLFLGTVLGFTAAEVNADLQAVVMWIFALVALYGLVQDRRHHNNSWPVGIAGVGLMVIVGTLYTYYDPLILLFGYVFLVVAAFLNQNIMLGSLNERIRKEKLKTEELAGELRDFSAKLSRYLSPQLHQSIFSGAKDVEISTDRKKLTVFFSDIVDFTSTTESMQPEDLAFLLNHYLTEMTDIALAHGATIDKFIGDAILLFFGDPESRGVKEDAMACVRMAVAMQKRMEALRRELKAKGYITPLHMRIGINTGYCNVGNFGSDQRIDYTIIGGEVNLASRLESLALPDSIVLSFATYSLVEDMIEAEAGEPMRVKGLADPVTPYRLIRLRNAT